MNLRGQADYIIEALKKQGVSILRYNAYSSNSIYLKFDYGVGGSLRISDHVGKKNLDYRFNLVEGVRQKHRDVVQSEDGKTRIRYYYNKSEMDVLIQDIIDFVDERKHTYTEDRYNFYMRNNQLKYLNKAKGFWSKCYRV